MQGGRAQHVRGDAWQLFQGGGMACTGCRQQSRLAAPQGRCCMPVKARAACLLA